MYFEFLLRRAHSRKRVERRYWSGESLYSRTTCSNSVMVGVIGPIGSGLPQFGFPRRFAMKNAFPLRGNELLSSFLNYMIPHIVFGMQQTWVQQIWMQQTASGQTNPYHDP
jgi:hypothetical protein